jgi:putative copper export protein
MLSPGSRKARTDVYQYVLILHLVGATVWTGGHLVLALCILPGALRRRSVSMLLDFESRFEWLGMTALAVQVATGLWLASLRIQNAAALLSPGSSDEWLVAAKLLLLLATLALAASARLRVIPRLSPERLPVLAWHIAGVTVISVLFVIAGVGLRTGGFW